MFLYTLAKLCEILSQIVYCCFNTKTMKLEKAMMFK